MGLVENLRRARDATMREMEMAERTRREMEARFENQRQRLREENQVSTLQLRRKSVFVKERAAETRNEIQHLESDMNSILQELRRERETNRASHNELDEYEHVHLEEERRLEDLENSRRTLHSEWLEACRSQEQAERERAIQEATVRSQNDTLRDMSSRVESMQTEIQNVKGQNKMLNLQVRREALIREINAAQHTRESLEKIKSNLVVAAKKGVKIIPVQEDSKDEEKKVETTLPRKFTIPELRLPNDLDTWSDAKIVKFLSRALNEIRTHHARFCELLVEGLEREIKVLEDYPLLTRNLLMLSASGEILMELVSRCRHDEFAYLASTLLLGPFHVYVFFSCVSFFCYYETIHSHTYTDTTTS